MNTTRQKECEKKMYSAREEQLEWDLSDFNLVNIGQMIFIQTPNVVIGLCSVRNLKK